MITAKITTHRNIDDFLDTCGGFLEEREVENGLMLALCLRGQARIKKGEDYPIHLMSLTEDSRIIAAAIQTPPHNLILSGDFSRAAIPLARHLHDTGSIPGVIGPTGATQDFVRAWKDLTGESAVLTVQQMIYELTRVTASEKNIPGTWRESTVEDMALLTRWFTDFVNEALTEAERERASKPEEIRKSLENRTLLLWENDGQPVSMAGVGGQTPNGARIGPVYTPPEHRGHGYASALVAVLSQQQLDQGRKYCMLYTDAENATSNAIYQRIGYNLVSHSHLYNFRK